MSNAELKLQKYEQSMRDAAYSIVQFAEKMEDIKSGAGEKSLTGIVDYLKEHYSLNEPKAIL